mgnify:CR=1 FL=1
MAPNGIIAHLFGPIEGHPHDAFMLGESNNLLPQLERMAKPKKNPSVFYVPTFSEKSQGPFTASCQVLFSWRPFNYF